MIVDHECDCHYKYDYDNDCVSDIYWKNEHRMMCTSGACTASERDRYEKTVCHSLYFCMFGLGVLDT